MKRAWPMVALAVVAIAISFALAHFAPTDEEPSSVAELSVGTDRDVEEQVDATAYDRALDALSARVEAAQRASDEHPSEWRRKEAVAAAFLARAELTDDAEDYLRAERALREAFAAAPEGTGPFLTRAEVHYAVRRFALVEPDLARLEQAGRMSRRTELRILALRAALAFQSGDFEAAERMHEELAEGERSPSSPLAYGRVLRWIGRADEAPPWLARAAVRADQGARMLAEVELELAGLELDRGRLDAAMEHVRAADERFPGYWRVEAQLAGVHASRGQHEEAERLYRALVERTGRPELMDALADVLVRREQARDAARVRAQAASAHEYAISVLPEATYPSAVEHFLRHGSASRALELAREDFALAPSGEASVRLAQALLRTGDREGARERVEAILATPFRSAELHATAARIYASIEDAEHAGEQERLARAIHRGAMEEIQWLRARR